MNITVEKLIVETYLAVLVILTVRGGGENLSNSFLQRRKTSLTVQKLTLNLSFQKFLGFQRLKGRSLLSGD